MLMRKGDVLFMNMNQKQELSLFAEELYRYMSPATLNQLAIEAGGMKRKRKCHGHHFLSLCVWLNQQVATTSLTQLCSQLETSTGVLLSPEGLNRRFNSASVAFFRTVFTTLEAYLRFLILFLPTLSAFASLILQPFKSQIDSHPLILVPEDVVIKLV